MTEHNSTKARAISRAKWSKRVSLLSGLALLSGCASTPVATVDPFRTALRDVCISEGDRLTEKTAEQIEANNLALRKGFNRGSQCPKPSGRKLVPYGPPAPPAAAASTEPSTS